MSEIEHKVAKVGASHERVSIRDSKKTESGTQESRKGATVRSCGMIDGRNGDAGTRDMKGRRTGGSAREKTSQTAVINFHS